MKSVTTILFVENDAVALTMYQKRLQREGFHVEIAEDGTLSRVKIVDPSFFNWPALPVALAETIVPDFPLVNKSFNLSYAGNDL